jgi:hypothetical protein
VIITVQSIKNIEDESPEIAAEELKEDFPEIVSDKLSLYDRCALENMINSNSFPPEKKKIGFFGEMT